MQIIKKSQNSFHENVTKTQIQRFYVLKIQKTIAIFSPLW